MTDDWGKRFPNSYKHNFKNHENKIDKATEQSIA